MTKRAQQQLNHQLFKDVLANSQALRLQNSRIISSGHVLETVHTNKISLSGYDDKRFILTDGVSTLPYGHFRTELELDFDAIANSPDWGSPEANWILDDQSSGLQGIHAENEGPDADCLSNLSDLLSNCSWETPDPGLARTPLRESEIDSTEVADLSNISLYETDGSYSYNPFIEHEAVEDDEETDDCLYQPRKQRRIIFESDESE